MALGEPTVTELSTRVDALGRRLVVVGVLGVVLALIGSAAGLIGGITLGILLTPDTVRASAFELEAPDGRLVSALQICGDGNARLQFFDATGTPRIDVGFLAADRPGVTVADASGRARATVAVEPGGDPGVMLDDAAGVVRACLGTDPAGVPSLTLCDASSQDRAWLSLSEKHEPLLALADATGAVGLEGTIYASGQRALRLFGSGTRRQAELVGDPDGGAWLRLESPGNAGVAILEADAAGGARTAFLSGPDGFRASLGCTPEDAGCLNVAGKSGKTQIAADFRHGEGAPRLVVFDLEGEPRLYQGCENDGAPFVILADRADRRQVRLGFETPELGPGLALHDAEGRRRGWLGLADGDAPELRRLDAGGKPIEQGR